MIALHESRCPDCGEPIYLGENIIKRKSGKVLHQICPLPITTGGCPVCLNPKKPHKPCEVCDQ